MLIPNLPEEVVIEVVEKVKGYLEGTDYNYRDYMCLGFTLFIYVKEGIFTYDIDSVDFTTCLDDKYKDLNLKVIITGSDDTWS